MFEFLHESGTVLTPEDKYTIAINIAKAMEMLHLRHNPKAHTHLTTKNIMLNPSDLHVYIADYSLRQLKKFAKLFHKYSNLTAWAAPEMWQE